MGKTSDGIAASDWDRVHDLALLIVNTADQPEEISHRRALLEYLDELTTKYGELPSLLATRADYVDDPAEAERLQLRACALATRIGDARNVCEISLSLADLYVTERPRPVAAKVWLEKARAHMSPDDEIRWAESRSIERRLEQNHL
jgi:hypothetical protein